MGCVGNQEAKGRAKPKGEFMKSHMEIDSLRTNFTTQIEGKKEERGSTKD